MTGREDRGVGPKTRSGMERGISAALGKHDRGEPLDEREWTIVYWVRYAAGCHACGGSRLPVIVRER